MWTNGCRPRTSLNRAPSDQRLIDGDIISLDSGRNHKGYIGDLCGITGSHRAGNVSSSGPIRRHAFPILRKKIGGCSLFVLYFCPRTTIIHSSRTDTERAAVVFAAWNGTRRSAKFAD
jgi:hypothetical protein